MRSHKTSLQTCSNFAVFNSLSSSFRVCDYGCVSFSVFFFFPFSLLNAHTLPGKLLFGFISFCCCCCLQPVSFSRAYFHPTSFRLFIFYFFAIKKKNLHRPVCNLCIHSTLSPCMLWHGERIRGATFITV